jgi:outer membrane protein
MRTRNLILLTMLLLLPVLLFSQDKTREEVAIGFVIDGPNQNIKGLDQLIVKEILDLTKGEFTITFLDQNRIVADWTPAGINSALDKLLADDGVDVIITLGSLASHEAARRKEFSKPVISPLIVDPTIQETPIQNGRSGIKNFNYVSPFLDTSGIIKSFAEIFHTRTLGAIIQKSSMDTVPKIREKAAAIEAEKGIKIKFLLAEEKAEDVLAQITEDIDSVYVSNLYRFSDEELIALANGLIERKIASITAEDRKELEKGFCATFTPETSKQRLARRVALNLQRILLGEKAEDLPVAFSEGSLWLST